MEEEQDLPKNNSTLSLEEYQTPTMSAPKFKAALAEKSEGEKQSSGKDILSFNTQQLINDINNKRKRDSTLVLEYKDALDQQTSIATEAIEETIQAVCGSSNAVLDDKLQELFTILDEIDKLEDELGSFKTAFSELYQTHVATQ